MNVVSTLVRSSFGSISKKSRNHDNSYAAQATPPTIWPYDRTVVFEAMAWNDTLACAMARLLLWMQPPALPAIGDKEGAWQYYLKAWRPGAPHRHTWDARYDTALKAAGL